MGCECPFRIYIPAIDSTTLIRITMMKSTPVTLSRGHRQISFTVGLKSNSFRSNKCQLPRVPIQSTSRCIGGNGRQCHYRTATRYPRWDVTIITSCCSNDSERPHRCCHVPNNFGSRRIFPLLHDGAMGCPQINPFLWGIWTHGPCLIHDSLDPVPLLMMRRT